MKLTTTQIGGTTWFIDEITTNKPKRVGVINYPGSGGDENLGKHYHLIAVTLRTNGHDLGHFESIEDAVEELKGYLVIKGMVKSIIEGMVGKQLADEISDDDLEAVGEIINLKELTKTEPLSVILIRAIFEIGCTEIFDDGDGQGLDDVDQVIKLWDGVDDLRIGFRLPELSGANEGVISYLYLIHQNTEPHIEDIADYGVSFGDHPAIKRILDAAGA